jgi:hypothetical protein
MAVASDGDPKIAGGSGNGEGLRLTSSSRQETETAKGPTLP